MSNSPLVSYTKYSPNNSGKRAHSIDRISPHCVVGQCTIESLGGWFAQLSAKCSSNYGIGKDGRIGLFVDEANRSWCTSSSANDNRAVTIECASDTTHPYRMNECVFESLVKLCADICKRNGKTILIWWPDKNKSLNYAPKANEMIITVHRWFANKACVPTYSEVLTKHGWVKLKDVGIGEEIACADLDNLRISFEEVYDKVPVRQQDTYTNNDLTATMDHRMVYRKQEQTDYRIDHYKQLLKRKDQIYIPLAGYADCEGLPLTDDMIRFYIAVQADGHYMKDKLADGKEFYYGVEFHLKKKRKIEQIKDILEACEFNWTESNKSDGSVSIRVYNTEETKIVEDICEKYLSNKAFTWEWLNLSPHQASVFLDEILVWDGCVAADLYSSNERINLDVVNAIAAINGKGSRISGNSVMFRDKPFMTLGREATSTKRNSKQSEGRQTEVSCVSVKTGVFLMRQNGKTFIVGNCPGDWLYCRLPELAQKVNVILAGSNPAPVNPAPKPADDLSDGTFMVRVKITDLNIRSGPGTSYRVVGTCPPGAYTIVQTQKVGTVDWGKLKSGVGWICLSYAERI